MTSNTYVFQVSRSRRNRPVKNEQGEVVRYKREQLRLRERVNKEGDITAWSTLHFDSLWLSGLHYAYLDGEKTAYSLSQKGELDICRVDIKFLPSHLEDLKKEVLTEPFLYPPTSEKGISLLRGIQLHVKLVENWQSVSTDTLTSIPYTQVEKVHLVREGEENWVHAPNSVVVHGATLMRAMYDFEDTKQRVLTTKEEVEEFLKKREKTAVEKSARQGRRRRQSNVAAAAAAASTAEEAPKEGVFGLDDILDIV